LHVGQKEDMHKSLALKTKDLYHRPVGALKMDKVELRGKFVRGRA
jgi:hypothetical protein